MKTSHLIRIALPGALAAALLASQVSQAADLVPPPGYYAAVGERKGSAGSCPAVPPPYTGSLVFTSKYEGSDSARATLNVKAEKTFRSQIKDITDMERGATKLVTQVHAQRPRRRPGLRTELDERLGPRRRPAERRLQPHRQVHAQMGAGQPLRRLHAPEVLQLAAARGPRRAEPGNRGLVRPARHPGSPRLERPAAEEDQQPFLLGGLVGDVHRGGDQPPRPLRLGGERVQGRRQPGRRAGLPAQRTQAPPARPRLPQLCAATAGDDRRVRPGQRRRPAPGEPRRPAAPGRAGDEGSRRRGNLRGEDRRGPGHDRPQGRQQVRLAGALLRPLPLRAEDARGEEGPRAVQQFPPRR